MIGEIVVWTLLELVEGNWAVWVALLGVFCFVLRLSFFLISRWRFSRRYLADSLPARRYRLEHLSVHPEKLDRVHARLTEIFQTRRRLAPRCRALESLLLLARTENSDIDSGNLLKVALEDPVPAIRRLAIEEAGHHPNPQSMGLLRRHLRAEEDYELNRVCCQVLVRFELGRLEELLRNEDFSGAEVSAHVLLVLGETQKTVTALLDRIALLRTTQTERLRSEEAEVRRRQARTRIQEAAAFLVSRNPDQAQVKLEAAMELDPLNQEARDVLDALPSIIAGLEHVNHAKARAKREEAVDHMRTTATEALRRRNYDRAGHEILSLLSVSPEDRWAKIVQQTLPGLRDEKKRIDEQAKVCCEVKRKCRLEASLVRDMQLADWPAAERRLRGLRALSPRDERLHALQSIVEESSRKQAEERTFEEAGKAIQAGEFDRAEAKLRYFLLRAVDPQPAQEALRRVAPLRQEWEETRRRQEAAAIEQAVAKLKQQAGNLLSQGERSLAAAAAQEILSIRPTDDFASQILERIEQMRKHECIETLRGKIEALLKEGEFDEGERTIGQLLAEELEPGRIQQLLQGLEALRRAHRDEQAQRAETIRSAKAERLRKAAEVCFKQEQYQKARAKAREWMTLRPEDPAAEALLGRCDRLEEDMRSRRRRDCAARLEVAIEREIKKGRWSAARTKLRGLAQLRPEDGELALLEKRIEGGILETASEKQWTGIKKLVDAGKLNQAEQRIQTLIVTDPKPERLFRMRDELPVIRRRLEESVKHQKQLQMKTALEKLRHQAELAFTKGECVGASAAARKILALDPNHPYARGLLEQIDVVERGNQHQALSNQLQERLGEADFDQAEQLIRVLLTIPKAHEHAQRLIAELPSMRERHRQAEERRIAEEKEHQAAGLRHSIEQSLGRGDFAQAIVVAHQWLTLLPADREARAVLELCDRKLREAEENRRFEAMHQRVCQLIRNGDAGDARIALRELAIQAPPNERGRVWAEQIDSLNKACQMLEQWRLAETSRQTAENLLGEARTLYEQGRLGECVGQLRRAAAFNPREERIDALLQLALEAEAAQAHQFQIQNRTPLNEYGELMA